MSMSLEYSQSLARNARAASSELAPIASGRKNAWLQRVASLLRTNSSLIVTANEKDMDAGAAAGLSSAMLDRLKLTSDRIETLAKAVEHIISLPDPVGEVVEGQPSAERVICQSRSSSSGRCFLYLRIASECHD